MGHVEEGAQKVPQAQKEIQDNLVHPVRKVNKDHKVQRVPEVFQEFKEHLEIVEKMVYLDCQAKEALQ